MYMVNKTREKEGEGRESGRVGAGRKRSPNSCGFSGSAQEASAVSVLAQNAPPLRFLQVATIVSAGLLPLSSERL